MVGHISFFYVESIAMSSTQLIMVVALFVVIGNLAKWAFPKAPKADKKDSHKSNSVAAPETNETTKDTIEHVCLREKLARRKSKTGL